MRVSLCPYQTYISGFWKNQITHLSIYAMDYVGTWPLVDFKEIPTFRPLRPLSFAYDLITMDLSIIVCHLP